MKWKVYIDTLHVYLRVATDVYLQSYWFVQERDLCIFVIWSSFNMPFIYVPANGKSDD